MTYDIGDSLARENAFYRDKAEDVDAANAMLLPWHEDLKEVARLYRWLEQIEEPPESVVEFLLNVETWQEKYELMLIFSPRGHGV